MSKKIIGSVMMGALALSLITPAVPAAPVDAAGKVTYKVKGTTLTISGKGEMPKSMVFGKKSKTKNIKKVVIKKGVTTISKNAFKNCKKLKKVQLPSTLKKISGYAFYNTALTNVTIPNSVKYIGNYSFYKCKKLKKVSTPADLYAYNRVDEKGVINDTPLEQLTFTSAIKSLNDISWNQFDTRAYVVNKNDKNFSSYKGAIYNKKGDTLMYIALYAKQAEVKPSCESILTSAFTNDLGDDNYVPVKELKEFTIPAGVKNIVKDGEPLPAGIQYSVLSKDLTKEGVAVLLGTIGEKEAMRQMPERISLAGDYVVIDKTYLAEFADKTDAKKKAEEETLEIPEGVETIPDEMFRNFNMKEVKLPSTIRTIGANAFYNCKKLMKINFPASLKEIGKDAFYWTEIGDCISKEWQAKKDTFYASFTEYEKKQKEEQAKRRNAKSIDCTGEAFDAVSDAYSYDSSMQNQFITLTMKESGIFYYYASEEVKLYDADKKEVNNCKQVKKGDVLCLKTPEKITGTFKIHNAFVCPELMSLKLGEDINKNYFMANGTAQYLPFTKKTNGGLIVRIVDLNLVATPNIKIEVQKKNGFKWTSVSKQISVKKGKKFDLYTHMNGTTAKDIQFALKKGEYRLKIMAKAGCVSQIAAYESDYHHLAKNSYGKTKKKAVNLYKTDFDLESNDMYYRFGYYFNEDKANTRWYRFVKTNKKQGALTIYNNMLSSGGFTASIYKKGTKKAVKTYRFDSKHMKDTSSDTKIVKYKLKTKGTYYIKISRNSKKVTGQYGVCFNYAK